MIFKFTTTNLRIVTKGIIKVFLIIRELIITTIENSAYYPSYS